MRQSIPAWFIGVVALCCPVTFAAADENNLVYEIFVRSFVDSNADGIGDLNGLAGRLDYLNDGDPHTDSDLEVGILWLMPIFPADSYHGYDVSNFEDVNPKYGTLNDLKDLVTKAHARGIRVILDIPFNHTSRHHEWFKLAAGGNTDMQKRYFFRSGNNQLTNGWHKVELSGANLQYFGLFDRSMP